MRKVVASLFISLDGVVEAPDQWQFDGFGEDMMAEMIAQINEIDTILLGRVTYQDWASYWPTAQDEPFASFINKTPKVVASNTLNKVEWGNFDSIKLIEGGLTAAINALKQQPGKNIGVNGSPGLVQSLLRLNLLDELHLQIHPVLAVRGKRLFTEAGDIKRLTLTENKTTSTGVVIVTYQPGGKA